MKVQAALARAEEVAEKKQVREAADKAVEHVVNLRQGLAHGEDPHGRGRAHGRGPVELWRVARSWWFLVWLAVGSAGRWCAGHLRGAVLGLQQGQADVQAALAAMMGELRSMAAAVTGLQQAAVSTTVPSSLAELRKSRAAMRCCPQESIP